MRSRGTSWGLGICLGVEKHLSSLWCYRAWWKTGWYVYQFGDFVLGASSAPAESLKFSQRRNNVIKESRVRAGGDNTLLKVREPPSLNCGLI